MRICPAFLILALGLPAFLFADGKPVIVYINFAGYDKAITDTAKARKASLEKCGFEVVDVEAQDQKELAQKLKAAGSKIKAANIIVDSHGSSLHGQKTIRFDDGEYDVGVFKHDPEVSFGLVREKSILIRGQDLIDTVDASVPYGQMWVDACYAGGCRRCSPGTLGIGMVCTEDQPSYNTAKNTEFLIELMCSGIGDCDLWKKADKNGDGRIGGKELEDYLDARLGQDRHTISRSASMHIVSVPSTGELDKFRAKCTTNKGQIKATTMGKSMKVVCKKRRREILKNGKKEPEVVESADWEQSLSYFFVKDFNKDRNFSEDSPDYFKDVDAADKYLKTHIAGWPKKISAEATDNGYQRKFTMEDCTIKAEPDEDFISLSCTISYEHMYTTEKAQDGYHMGSVSLAPKYELSSPQCRTHFPPSQKSGLQFLESEEFKMHDKP